MPDLLLTLLRRIRDGHADPSEIERARELVARDARLDDELRAIALTDADDLAGDAAGLLAVLGADDLGALIASAIAHEAASADLTEIDAAALDAQGWTHGPAVARAVAREAGAVEVARPVLAACALAEGWDSSGVAGAIRYEAGSIDVVAAVLRACGLSTDALPVAAAVRHEAGHVDVADRVAPWTDLDVAGAIRAAAGHIEIAAEVMAKIARPYVVADDPAPIARPANDVRGFAAVGLLLAAAVALFVSLAGIDTSRDGALPALAFASADEVVVEDLQSEHADVLMLQGAGQDGTLILWVDEET